MFYPCGYADDAKDVYATSPVCLIAETLVTLTGPPEIVEDGPYLRAYVQGFVYTTAFRDPRVAHEEKACYLPFTPHNEGQHLWQVPLTLRFDGHQTEEIRHLPLTKDTRLWVRGDLCLDWGADQRFRGLVLGPQEYKVMPPHDLCAQRDEITERQNDPAQQSEQQKAVMAHPDFASCHCSCHALVAAGYEPLDPERACPLCTHVDAQGATLAGNNRGRIPCAQGESYKYHSAAQGAGPALAVSQESTSTP